MKLKESQSSFRSAGEYAKIFETYQSTCCKAKVGPRVMTLMCDAKIFDLIPIKKEVKATVSGIYITAVKGVRGTTRGSGKSKEKKAFFARFKKDNK